MNVFQACSRLERQILAVLNESGEENFVALLNTIFNRDGNATKIQLATVALTNLFRLKLIEFSDAFNMTEKSWVALPHKKVLGKLDALRDSIGWSVNTSSWVWLSSEPRLVVLTTTDGSRMGTQILEKDGWSITRATM